MKKILSLVAVTMLSFQPNLSALAKDPPASPVDSKVLVLSQATTDVQLEHKDAEPIYGTQQVPDTCYRDVQHGTRQDCNTEYDHQCHTSIENQCHQEAYPVCHDVQQNVCNPVSNQVCESISRNVCENVPYPVCSDVPEQVCQNVPSQECHSVNVPVCQSVPRSVCGTTQECTTVQDSVCHGSPPNQVCQTVPRRECKPVESCHTENDSVCHDETRNQCSNVDHQVCHSENRRQCHNENRQECHTVPDSVCHTETHQDCHLENQSQCHDEYRQACANEPVEHCQDVPHQVCETVPNMVNEPYACTRDVQVQTGERLIAHSTAQIHLVVSNFGSVDISHENLKVVLKADDVSLAFDHGSNKVLFRVVKKDQQVQPVSSIEKQIKVTFTLEAYSVDQFGSLADAKMSTPVLYFDKVTFKLEGVNLKGISVSFDQGHLKLVQKRFLGHATLADKDIDGALVKAVDDHYEIDLQAAGASGVKSKQSDLTLSLTAKDMLNRAELLNPSLLDQVSMPPISGSFSGLPISGSFSGLPISE